MVAPIVPDWVPMFLQTLRESGNVRTACATVNISRRRALAQRDKNDKFRRDWDDAVEDAIDSLEQTARDRAMEASDTLLIFLLKSHRRSVYGDQKKVDVTSRKMDAVEPKDLSDEELAQIAAQGKARPGSERDAAPAAGADEPT